MFDDSTLLSIILAVNVAPIFVLVMLQGGTHQRIFTNKKIKWWRLSFLGSYGKGNYKGIHYEYFCSSKNGLLGPFFRVSIACPCPGSFLISAKKRKTINTANQFHDRFIIDTDSPLFSTMFLKDADMQGLVEKLYQKGFNHILHDGKRLFVINSPMGLDNGLNEKTINEVVSLMSLLIRGMSRETGIQDHPSKPFESKQMIVYNIPVFIQLLGLIALFEGLHEYRPLDLWGLILHSLKISIPVLVLFLLMAVKCLRTQPRPLRPIVVILVFSIIVFPIGGSGMGIFLNGFLDSAEPVTHNVMVTDKYEIKPSRISGIHHYIKIEEWRSGDTFSEILVIPGDYDEIKPGVSRCYIRIKPGRFNFPWLLDYRILTPGSN